MIAARPRRARGRPGGPPPPRAARRRPAPALVLSRAPASTWSARDPPAPRLWARLPPRTASRASTLAPHAWARAPALVQVQVPVPAPVQPRGLRLPPPRLRQPARAPVRRWPWSPFLAPPP